MITKLNNYINEKISNINKLYIESIYNLFLVNKYGEYYIELKNSRLKIKAKIIFNKNGGIKKSSFNDDFNDKYFFY